MNRISILISVYLALFVIFVTNLSAQNISRFEYFGSEKGLSQNSVYSMFCDENGFLWIGTMNGLNRFDGKYFKVYSHTMSRDLSADGEPSVNGRIERIWGDKRHYVWLETYDGQYRFFNQRTEKFSVLPGADSMGRPDEATAFSQYADDMVIVGTKNSGLFILRYNETTLSYDRENISITDNYGKPKNILSLLTDANGTLWIETNDGILSIDEQRMRVSGITPTQKLLEMPMSGAICETSSDVLFGTRGHGLLRCDKHSGNITNVSGTYITDHMGVVKLHHVQGKGTLVATDNAHLFVIDNNGVVEPIQYHGTDVANVENFYTDRFDQVWITTAGKGVTRYDMLAHESKFYQLVPSDLAASIDQERPFFYEDSGKDLWIGLHGGGLLRYDRLQDRFYAWLNDMADPHSIPSNVVHCMTEDKAGNLWVGTGPYLGGLVRVMEDSKAFRTIAPNSKGRTHTDNVVRSMLTDNAGHVWVGTKGCDICVFDSNGQLVSSTNKLKCSDGQMVSGMPYGFLVTHDNRLWIATKGKGIFISSAPVNFSNPKIDEIIFDRIDRTLLVQSANSQALSHDYIYSLAEDERGQIWAASYGGGLYRISTNGRTMDIDVFSSQNSPLLSDKVRYVMVDSKGGLWIGSVNGVNYIIAKDLGSKLPIMQSFTYDANAESLGYNDICYIFEDSQGDIYFATMGGGLTVMSQRQGTRHFKTYTNLNGLCNNTVYGITQDARGDIWISTENGISCLNRDRGSFESFNDNKGLAFNSFSEASVCKQADGSILFGGSNGFTCIRPQDIPQRRCDEPLMLTDLFINNTEQHLTDDKTLKESISFAKEIVLQHSQSNIAVRYASMDFTDPRSARYSYILEGLDKDWNNVGNEDRAVYTNLTPGNYKLKIRHMTSNGLWSTQTRDLDITVLPPLWLSPWAIVLYVALAMLVLFWVYRNWKRINKYREELNVEKRLNDVKLQFFTNIAHEIRTPLTLIVSPIDSLLSQPLDADVRSQIVTIRRSADRLLKLVSQLLEFRKVQEKKVHLTIREVEIGTFARQCADTFAPLAKQKQINFVCQIPSGLSKVWLDTDEMDTVIYNLLSNAFKFTNSGKSVELAISQTSTHTYITVSDQGRGIDPNDVGELFKQYSILSTNDLSGTGIGLSLSHSLVELHHGQLTVESELGVGSTFRIALLNGRAHFDSDPMVSFAPTNGSEANAAANGNMPPMQSMLAHVTIDDVSTPSAAPVAQAPADAPQVLIVEDNDDIRSYLLRSLSPIFRVREAHNGQEALEMVAAEVPDLIITDLMMPVMSGEVLIQKLRADFTTSHVLIVALSAKSSVDDQIDVYNNGADAYLTKPFNVHHLIAVAKSLLRRRANTVTQLVGLPLNNASDAYTTHGTPLAEGEPQNAEVQCENEEVDETVLAERYEQSQDLLQNTDVTVALPKKDEEFLRNVISFAEANYKQNPGIEQFAEHFNMSRTVFYNKVKSLTGKGPLDFVRQIRFKIAADMLRKGYNVSEAAFEIGYSDVKYFSKLFKQFFGYSPSQEKKNADKSN